MKNEITIESVMDIIGKANLEAYGVNPYEVTVKDELLDEEMNKLEVRCECDSEKICRCGELTKDCTCDEQYMNYQDNNLQYA